ncbi:MAG TPA: hypothetical protein VF386_01425 [Usitatibacter sp.]
MEPNGTADEAQRVLEQRALRNVRGLVDKMETIEHVDQRSQRRMLLWIVAAALVAVVVLGLVVSFSAHRQSSDAPVVIESGKPSPAPAGQAPKRQ